MGCVMKCNSCNDVRRYDNSCISIKDGKLKIKCEKCGSKNEMYLDLDSEAADDLPF